MRSRLFVSLTFCVLFTTAAVICYSSIFLSQDDPPLKRVAHQLEHGNVKLKSITQHQHQRYHPFVPRTEEEAMVFGNLYKCLYSVNLTHYFQENGVMDLALQSARDFLRNVHHYLPHKQTSYQSHCWSVKTNIAVNSTTGTFSGSVRNLYSFKLENMSNMHSFTLNNLQKKHRDGFEFSFTRVCLPHIFVPGFAKCGTTFLYSLIMHHPNIVAGLSKEPRWWIRSASLPDDHFTAYFAMYFTNYIPLLYYNQDRRWGKSVDGSPSLLYEWPMSPSQPHEVNYCLLPSVIPQLLPDSKFIVVMRNPVNALYSWFWFSCTRESSGVSLERKMQLKGPRIFHERVLEAIKIFNSCRKKFPIAKCVMDLRFMANGSAYSNNVLFPHCGWLMLHPMIYYVHIQKWLAIVPKERFLFLTLEELSSNPQRGAYNVWTFLGVPEFYKGVGDSFTNEQIAVNYHSDSRLKMRADTKRLLDDFFRPYNLKLTDLLGNNKFLFFWQSS